MKKGVIAAMKQGIPVPGSPASGVHVGPRGGRFYFNAHGNKVYGEPPKVGDHIKKGATLEVDVGDEGWLKGKVTHVKRSGQVITELDDGSGAVQAHHSAVRVTREAAVARGAKIMEEAPPDPGWRQRLKHHSEKGFSGDPQDGFTSPHVVTPWLTQEQKSAIQAFTGIAYHEIRAYERGAAPNASSHVKKMAKDINDALDKHATEIDGVLHRGMGNLSKEQCQEIIGQTMFQFNAMSSATRRVQVAEGFSSGHGGSQYAIRFEIHKAQGLPIETISGIKSEREVLLAKGTNYHPRRIWKEGPTKYVVEMEGAYDE